MDTLPSLCTVYRALGQISCEIYWWRRIASHLAAVLRDVIPAEAFELYEPSESSTISRVQFLIDC